MPKKKAQYRALVELYLPKNEAETKRILAARAANMPIPFAERDMVVYQSGDEIDYVPEVSLMSLLEQNQIEEI